MKAAQKERYPRRSSSVSALRSHVKRRLPTSGLIVQPVMPAADVTVDVMRDIVSASRFFNPG